MIYIWLAALVLVIISAVTTGWAALRAAPFVPTRMADVRRMMALAQLHSGDHVIDLGAGDARLLTEALKVPGVTALGYELSWPVWVAGQLRIRFYHAGGRAKLRAQDFFHHSLADATVVMCFLTPGAMAKLAPKFQAELRPGTRVVSAVFPIPGWTPVKRDKPTGRVSVYLYRM